MSGKALARYMESIGWSRRTVGRTTVYEGPSNVIIMVHPDMTASEVMSVVAMVEEGE